MVRTVARRLLKRSLKVKCQMLNANASSTFNIEHSPRVFQQPVLNVDRIESPIGPLTVAEHDGHSVCSTSAGAPVSARCCRAGIQRRNHMRGTVRHAGGSCNGISRGDLRAIDTVTVELNGTPFQQRVWNALRCNSRQDRHVATSRARRARSERRRGPSVGAANGANPVPGRPLPPRDRRERDARSGLSSGGLAPKALALLRPH